MLRPPDPMSKGVSALAFQYTLNRIQCGLAPSALRINARKFSDPDSMRIRPNRLSCGLKSSVTELNLGVASITWLAL